MNAQKILIVYVHFEQGDMKEEIVFSAPLPTKTTSCEVFKTVKGCVIIGTIQGLLAIYKSTQLCSPPLCAYNSLPDPTKTSSNIKMSLFYI